MCVVTCNVTTLLCAAPMNWPPAVLYQKCRETCVCVTRCHVARFHWALFTSYILLFANLPSTIKEVPHSVTLYCFCDAK